MMMSDAEGFIDRFVRKRLSPFSAADVQRELPFDLRIPKNIIDEMLQLHPGVFDYTDNLYISRAGFFTRREFSLVPLGSEIHSGILIIGHRCMPYTDPEQLPNELHFVSGGKPVPKKTARIKTQEAFDRYALFGEEYAAQFFSLDPANELVNFAENDYFMPSTIDLTVLDMSCLYKEWAFETGGRLVAFVSDWDKGIVDLRPLPQGQKERILGGREDSVRRAWLEAMENALIESIETFGACNSIDEQLAGAFLAGEGALFGGEGACLDEFLRYTDKLEFVEFGVETRLWKKGEEIPALLPQEIEDAGIRPLELFLGSGPDQRLSETVLNAYVFDSLYKKETSALQLMQRLVTPDIVIPRKYMETFLLQLERRRAILIQNYNWFADFEKGKLRAQVLDLYAQVLDFVCAVENSGADPQELPQQPLIVLTQLHGHMLYILEAVEPEETVSEKDFSAMYFSLEGMCDSFEDIKEDLAEALDKNTKQKFSLC